MCFSPYTRTFIYLILHSSYEIRKQAYDMIRRLVNNLRSTETDISLAILNGLNSYLEHFQLTVNRKKLNDLNKMNSFDLEWSINSGWKQSHNNIEEFRRNNFLFSELNAHAKWTNKKSSSSSIITCLLFKFQCTYD